MVLWSLPILCCIAFFASPEDICLLELEKRFMDSINLLYFVLLLVLFAAMIVVVCIVLSKYDKKLYPEPSFESKVC